MENRTKEYYKLSHILSNLSTGDCIHISDFNSFKVRHGKTDKVESFISPFTSNSEYMNFVDGLFGLFSGTCTILDRENMIHAVCVNGCSNIPFLTFRKL